MMKKTTTAMMAAGASLRFLVLPIRRSRSSSGSTRCLRRSPRMKYVRGFSFSHFLVFQFLRLRLSHHPFDLREVRDAGEHFQGAVLPHGDMAPLFHRPLFFLFF